MSERSEAFSATFRPVSLIELLQPHAARAASPEAPIHQGDESLTTPAPRPETASDAFTRSGAGGPHPPAADPAPTSPSVTMAGRSLGFNFTASDLANPSPAGSAIPDAAGTGGAGGAAHHFSLLGRPMDASPVAQPPGSLAFANADDLYLRLAEQVQLQVREGKSSMRIQLKPETLGRLEIRAESTAAGLTATITTENHGVKAFLEQNLHNLYRTLQDMGLKVDRILVTEEGSQHHAPGQFHDSEAHSGQERSYPYGEPAWLPGDPAAPAEPIPAAQAVPNYWMPHSTFHAVA